MYLKDVPGRKLQYSQLTELRKVKAYVSQESIICNNISCNVTLACVQLRINFYYKKEYITNDVFNKSQKHKLSEIFLI